MDTQTEQGKVEGWYVELNSNKARCITCQRLTYGRNEYGNPQDFTCYFDHLVETSR